MMIIIIIIRGWGEGAILTHLGGIVTDIQRPYAQDRPYVMKSHILQDILTEHGGYTVV
jgi:hypothetical protein